MCPVAREDRIRYLSLAKLARKPLYQVKAPSEFQVNKIDCNNHVIKKPIIEDIWIQITPYKKTKQLHIVFIF